MPTGILTIRDLKVNYYLYEGTVRAVDGVSLHLEQDEILGLIGESGSGKTTLGRAIVKVLPSYARIVSGSIVFLGQNLVEKNETEMRRIRGAKISLIFQDPTRSLNPALKIGEQIGEVIRLHRNIRRKSEVKRMVIEILDKVGISDAERRLSCNPYELSIGMRQRVMIAMALSAHPRLVIADEPTSSVDVSTQAQVLELMRQLKEELKFCMILITHNIGVAAEMCDRIGIMYAGMLVEYADKITMLAKSRHPYSFALMKAVPFLHTSVDRLYIIRGNPPDLSRPPSGCPFHPRCDYATEVCKDKKPPLVELGSDHMIACFHPL